MNSSGVTRLTERERENRRSEVRTAGLSIYPVDGVRSPAVQGVVRRVFRWRWWVSKPAGAGVAGDSGSGVGPMVASVQCRSGSCLSGSGLGFGSPTGFSVITESNAVKHGQLKSTTAKGFGST
ncbi:hypothetical protein Hdeb2414_s0130g00806491 [Helianthus debilis subsp. tardiflorus]